ncbi:sensor histidine kinase [Paenibacillus radicis (ex Gao et al. 2016)]|uniref:histidine kinase n=1 Tax=Paenibacillus radicis (ex Gao et al. 2016) TaxID=1737354 RepID=A0A917HHV7_9BACL|nr:histidine kinase [Paenibacillus radicis (ex Gao et al. 2016)]GGG79017.1 hypothetical protein GCM10010918_40020 [Paenibacillus radicis (ex Gao et al. 2016)]
MQDRMNAVQSGKIVPHTLKGRLALVLVLATAIPIVLIGLVSYYWIYDIQIGRIGQDIQNQVEREQQEMEKRLDELGRVSQLLVGEGGIGQDVMTFISSKDAYEKTKLYDKILQSTSNINFANPSLGVMLYYAPTYKDPFLFANMKVEQELLLHPGQTMYSKNKFAYYGPHPSVRVYNKVLVLSLWREVENEEGVPLSIYIERDISDLMIASRPGDILVSSSGQVLYSHNESAYKIGDVYGKPPEETKAFAATSRNGWTYIHFVPLSEYNGEINVWFYQFIAIALLSLLIGILLAWFIWKMVYGPIRVINREIHHFQIGQGNDSRKLATTGTVEFDNVLNNFDNMKNRIMELIADIEEKEKRKGQLEVEKLLVQINPHFLHNTLNTVQWLARMNGQKDIANLVAVFTRVLHYNLGKKSIIVTVRDEVQALRDYIELQSIRYDHKFQVHVNAEEDADDIAIPRFIMQPLVENALYHAFDNEEGQIEVTIRLAPGGRMQIIVQDNGQGIPPERMHELFELDEQRQRSGLGIGLRYVKKMLEVYYGSEAQFSVHSAPGEGTTITIDMPDQVKVEE